MSSSSPGTSSPPSPSLPPGRLSCLEVGGGVRDLNTVNTLQSAVCSLQSSLSHLMSAVSTATEWGVSRLVSFCSTRLRLTGVNSSLVSG